VYIDYATHETSSAATGTVVVVDVWRSFTTTAFAFAAGVRDILVAGSAEEAYELRQRFPRSTLVGMGELGGSPAEGFDYGNSPAALIDCDLSGQRVILCTPNGTPSMVKSKKAQLLIAGSFVCAGATVRYLRQQSVDRVTFVCTEAEIEDQAYAEYMTALLQGKIPDGAMMLGKIKQAALLHARTLLAHGRLTEARVNMLNADLDCCLALDHFNFAMVAKYCDGLLIMEALPGPGKMNRNSQVEH
jgi:2-phosphosulfolactate phosphatase